MKTEVTKIDLTQVADLILKGIDCWIKAGEIIASALDREPDSMDRICEVTGLSSDIVRRFEQIGRKEVYPKLLANTSVGYRKLAACTYREQKLYSENPIELIVLKPDGDTDMLSTGVQNLTPEQCKQVFAKGHIRTQSEQRAWLESERKKSFERDLKIKTTNHPLHFKVAKNTLVVYEPWQFTRQELAKILAEMA